MLLAAIIAGGLLTSVGLIYDRGLWQNLLLWINVMVAGLVATCTFEPLAAFVSAQAPAAANYADILSLWAVFAVVLFGLRAATDFLTAGRLSFRPVVDKVGGALFAAAAIGSLVCFSAMSLHLAPLAREFMGFKAEEPLVFGYKPDRYWLALVQKLSLGSFARGGTESDPEAHAFDPRGEFAFKYAARREFLERVDPAQQAPPK